MHPAVPIRPIAQRLEAAHPVGAIGYGYAGRTFHASLIRAAEGLEAGKLAGGGCGSRVKAPPFKALELEPGALWIQAPWNASSLPVEKFTGLVLMPLAVLGLGK